MTATDGEVQWLNYPASLCARERSVTPRSSVQPSFFDSARWYDRSINWSARLAREVPVLRDVFGPPGERGLIDAGCGPGHQAIALARAGYRVVGADASADMLDVARGDAEHGPPNVSFVQASYDDLPGRLGSGFDGVYCLGNSLAAAASADAVRTALQNFSACLRIGGRLFIQVLNFPPMRAERPCIRGPRVSRVDGQEYISVRVFHFAGALAEITNVTLWHDDTWHQHAATGPLYPVTSQELELWCQEAGLSVNDLWGSYAREPFEPEAATDLLLTATRR